ncbi:NUDIX domain-containing protein [Thermoflexus sp.]|uniref:NUDIX domain-containing protein n=1 Tax=Thermoflexus sp. TaxID=1969742 RepID=UPI0025DF5287|nr:NUDIX domain-containing protein [Thermoflexus sp.]MCS6962621.1 NUDIX domain-containing protein [Thermoflexus sp.]MCX7690591.1 NUDIX domain-containing protein [Thermoflexus sp.]MDW8065830.1 NUDIX domain-containing protein [Anaerolineae bacterium]MDW8185051.1 NUDIX domain-containing protein [Anaerolineae bacterium]
MNVEIRVEIVALADEAVWLVQSPPGNWTLPGGPLVEGEDPADGVRRWMTQMAGVEPEEPIILEAASRREDGRWQLILRYACRLLQEPRPASELPMSGLFHIEHLPPLDPGQRAAIYRALQLL